MEGNEDLLQYIWKNQLFKTPLLKPSGSIIEVIDPGRHSTDSGPDFFNAKIKDGPITWVGNVEVHKNASDWYRHRHHLDPAFDNVILHAVAVNDRRVFNSMGREIFTVNMKFNQDHLRKYRDLQADKDAIARMNGTGNNNRDWLYLWLENLYMERLEERINAITLSFEQTGGDWEEVLYRALGRAMGQKTNAEPFEILTRSISLETINKYCPDMHGKESILFGQAGMLNNPQGDPYYLGMKQSYDILRHKHKLQPMEGYLWKYLRLRPQNFPDIRIAQFAWMLDKFPALFYRISRMRDPAAFMMNMKLSTSGYWTEHFRLNKPGRPGEKIVGKEKLSGLLINAVVPVLCAYMRERGDKANLLEISHLSERLPVENNRVIRVWRNLGIPVRDGFSSQAILQLTKKLGLLK